MGDIFAFSPDPPTVKTRKSERCEESQTILANSSIEIAVRSYSYTSGFGKGLGSRTRRTRWRKR